MTDIAPSTTTDIAIPEPKSVSLDLYADLVKQEEFLADTIKEWEKQLAEIRGKLQDVLKAADADEATFAGRPVYTWHRINRLRTKDFIKDRPNLAQIARVVDGAVVAGGRLDLPAHARRPRDVALVERALKRAPLGVGPPVFDKKGRDR